MPFTAAQDYFNRADRADEIEVLVTEPDQVEDVVAHGTIGAALHPILELERRLWQLSARVDD